MPILKKKKDHKSITKPFTIRPQKTEQTKPKANRSKEVIKTRQKLLKRRIEKQQRKSIKLKAGSLYQQNWQTYRLKIKKTQTTRVRNEREDITTDFREIEGLWMNTKNNCMPMH